MTTRTDYTPDPVDAAFYLYRRLLVAQWVDEFCDTLETRDTAA